jgi:hypothetical protein
MAKKKIAVTEIERIVPLGGVLPVKRVRVTGPNCWAGDRHYLPGETANVPEALASEWINSKRAVWIAAEDTK